MGLPATRAALAAPLPRLVPPLLHLHSRLHPRPRLAGVGSERAAHHWLRTASTLGELLNRPFESVSHRQLYRASDALIRNRQSLEQRLFQAIFSLFALQSTLTLHDLINTGFEGEAGSQPLEQRGHSKEKRSDGLWLTLP